VLILGAGVPTVLHVSNKDGETSLRKKKPGELRAEVMVLPQNIWS
jgi:hypothetical protein